MARVTRTLVPVFLFASVSLLVIALIGTQGGAKLPFFTTLLPILILVGMTWYLIAIIIERKTIMGFIKIWIEMLIRQRGKAGGHRYGLVAYLASFAVFMVFISILGRVRSVQRLIMEVTAPLTSAGQAIAGQLIGTPSDLATTSMVFYGQVMAYSSAIVFAGIIVVSLALIVGGVVGGLRRLEEIGLPSVEAAAFQTLETIRDTSKQLEAGGDYPELILACYKTMCELLTVHGARAYESQTPREFERVAEKVLPVSRHALDRLTRLFEVARYSTHAIDQTERMEAVECLREIEGELSKEILNVPA